jgi:hypothetical protein
VKSQVETVGIDLFPETEDTPSLLTAIVSRVGTVAAGRAELYNVGLMPLNCFRRQAKGVLGDHEQSGK